MQGRKLCGVVVQPNLEYVSPCQVGKLLVRRWWFGQDCARALTSFESVQAPFPDN